MPLSHGVGSVRKNVTELMTSKPGKSRAKAIRTYAKKHKVSLKVAKMKLSLAIAYSQAKKK